MERKEATSSPVVLPDLSGDFYGSQKKYYSLQLFWLGFIIYTLSYVIKGNSHFSLKIGELIQFIGFCVLLPGFFNLIRPRIRSPYLQVLFALYFLWSLSVVARGFHFNHAYLKETLLEAGSGVMLYVLPMVLLIPMDDFFFKKLFDAIVVLGIAYLFYMVLFIGPLLDRGAETQNVIENLVWNLSMPCGFILMTYRYHSGKRKFLAFVVMMLSLLFTIYRARRGLSTILLGILLSGYWLYLFSAKKKILIIYLTALCVFAGLYYASTIYNITNNKLFGFIAERGTADTRSDVEDYFYGDMKEKDWLEGRGINGEYYCPDIDVGQLTDFRDYIETGYLQIVLKGGLIRLGLFLLIALPAILAGLFSSRNILAKAAALWILVDILSLYPASPESFSLQFLLVWISIAICYNRRLRKLTDEEVTELLHVA